MNPDPVAKLARFTPTAPDAADLLFAAGRASARTHWLWKGAVAALLTSNLALGALFALRSTDAPQAPQAAPVAQPVPEPPTAQQVSPPSSAPADDPSSYRTLRGSDPEHAPLPETFPTAPRESLTVLSGRRGELD